MRGLRQRAGHHGRAELFGVGDRRDKPVRLEHPRGRPGLLLARFNEQVPAGSEPPWGPSARRLCTSSPSAPPLRATSVSWSRASGGLRARASVGTQGVLATRMSTRPFSDAVSGSNRSPSKTRSGRMLRRALATAAGSISAAYRSIPGSRAAIAAPIAPAPQQRSRTMESGAAHAAALWTGKVCWRGTKTPASTRMRRPQNSTQPRMCSSGIPETRRSTSSLSPAGEHAASMRSAASSSAR